MYININNKSVNEIYMEYNNLRRFDSNNQVIFDFKGDSAFTQYIPLLKKIKKTCTNDIILKNVGQTCKPFVNFCIDNNIFLNKKR